MKVSLFNNRPLKKTLKVTPLTILSDVSRSYPNIKPDLDTSFGNLRFGKSINKPNYYSFADNLSKFINHAVNCGVVEGGIDYDYLKAHISDILYVQSQIIKFDEQDRNHVLSIFFDSKDFGTIWDYFIDLRE